MPHYPITLLILLCFFGRITAARPRSTKIVTSADGTNIYAEAVGDSTKPPIVFIHGFTSTAEVFNEVFADRPLLERHYLASFQFMLIVPVWC